VSLSRPRFTIRRWMAVVGVFALILTPLTWLARVPAEFRLPGLVNLAMVFVLFSPIIFECYKGVRRLKRRGRRVRDDDPTRSGNVKPDP
jgi:hypothetical protein